MMVANPTTRSRLHDRRCRAIGDAWLRTNLGAYAVWARTHHSVLIVVSGTPAPLIVTGASVPAGSFPQKVNQYSILRTIEDWYGLPCLGHSCDVKPIAALG